MLWSHARSLGLGGGVALGPIAPLPVGVVGPAPVGPSLLTVGFAPLCLPGVLLRAVPFLGPPEQNKIG